MQPYNRDIILCQWAFGRFAELDYMKIKNMVAIGAIASLLGSLSAQANDMPSTGELLAQGTELGCRQTNASTGVYAQPNLDSTSRGLLNRAQVVRLQRKGEGWARISQPLIGWVESRYLTPAVSCDPLNSNTTIQNPPTPQISALPPAPSPASSPAPTITSVRVTCDILPPGGLIVRSEPLVADRTYLTTIPAGTHEFQFTRDSRVTRSGDSTRRWVYITAPATGWITLGLEGQPSNLGGNTCG
jgi:hypothetical protein